MKKIIIMGATIILGIFFALQIAGDGDNSLKKAGSELLTGQINQLKTLDLEKGDIE